MHPAWLLGTIVLAGLAAGPAAPAAAQEQQLRKEAFALYEKGLVEEAIPLFEECLRLDPGDASVLETLGYVRYRAEDFDRSRRLFESLLRSGADRSYALFMLGNIAFREFELGKALRFYEEVASRDPGYPSLEENIALLREKIGRVEELKKLRGRCDFFYFGSLVLGALLLAAIAICEAGGRRGREFPDS